jgi:hypothetical protein
MHGVEGLQVGSAHRTLIQNPYFNFIISTNYNPIFHGPNSLTSQVIYNGGCMHRFTSVELNEFEII